MLAKTPFSIVEHMTREGFCEPRRFGSGCTSWRNGLPHDFSYPEIETDPEKRAALTARIEEIANAKTAGRKKAKKAKSMESTHAVSDGRSPEVGVALDVITAPGME